MKRHLALALSLASCAQLADDVAYRCELDGGCFQADHVCGADGYCRAQAGAGGGNATGGGAVGGGAVGGGSVGGGAVGGGSVGGGSVGGGAVGGGSVGGGMGGGDGGCVPKTCPGTSFFDCGPLDDGCGHTVNCSQLSDGGMHTCAPQTFCGAGLHANICEAPISCTDGWCWENPLPQGNTLNAVWGPSSSMWAVGDLGTLLYFNGQYWKLAPSPTRSNLRAVQGRSASDVWAAGDDGVILHYDGTAWTVAKVDMGSRFRALAVAPTGEVFVGGEAARFLTYAAGVWQPQMLPLDTVNALWAVDADLVYAAGATTGTSLAVAWSSGVATPIDAPKLHEVFALLGTPDGGLLAGADSCIVAQLAGGQLLPLPGNGSCDAGVFTLAGTSDTDLYAAGPGFVAHYDGTFFSLDLGDAGTWRGASAPDVGNAVLVGDHGLMGRAAGMFLYFDSRGVTTDVTSVLAAASGELLAGSEQGVVLKRSTVNRAGAWSPIVPTVSVERVTSLWGTSSSDLWAVTDQGTIGHTIPTGFLITQVPDSSLFAVTSHLSEIQIAGSDAGAFHISSGLPQDYALEQLPAQVVNQHQTIRGLFSNGTQLFGVTGHGDLIESDNGRVWISDVPIGTDLRAVHGASNFLLVAGGDGGVFTGTSTLDIAFTPTGSRSNFNGAVARSSTSAWVVGDQGAALQLSGTTWASLPAPTASDLLGVTATPDGGLFAVGRQGTVLFRP